MPGFSEGTLSMLYRAGWSEERKVDTTAYEQRLKDEGYEIFPIALAFLGCFGDLEIKYPNNLVPSIISGFSLNLLETLERTSLASIQTYSRMLKTPVTVIGMESDNGLLLMNPDGKVFDVFDTWMMEVGESGEDAIEALCSGRELKKIPHPRGHQP